MNKNGTTSRTKTNSFLPHTVYSLLACDDYVQQFTVESMIDDDEMIVMTENR